MGAPDGEQEGRCTATFVSPKKRAVNEAAALACPAFCSSLSRNHLI